MQKYLIKKITAKKCKIAVIGLGHIGLPITMLLIKAGYDVVGVDVNPVVIKIISNHKSPINEPGLGDLIRIKIFSDKLHVTTDVKKSVQDSDIVIVCVPTPFTKGKPDLSYLKNVCLEIGLVLKKGHFIIIESTTPPHTINDFVVPLIEKISNLKIGVDFWLAYCPERIMPGAALKELIENDRIIGGYGKDDIEMATLLYKSIINGNVHSTDTVTAEVVKLVENAYRDVNIAFANELAIICEKIGCDAVKVIELANTHPRVNIHRPGPGVGGPCLSKDPLLLLNPFNSDKIPSIIIKDGRLINEKMPKHVVEIIKKALLQVSKYVKTSRIAVLGVAYKADVGDTRFTPSELVIKELLRLKSKVIVYDPYCKVSFGADLVESIDQAIEKADCLVILTDHKNFKRIDLKKIKNSMNDKPIIVDTRRMLDPLKVEENGFIYYGIGFGRGT